MVTCRDIQRIQSQIEEVRKQYRNRRIGYGTTGDTLLLVVDDGPVTSFDMKDPDLIWKVRTLVRGVKS